MNEFIGNKEVIEYFNEVFKNKKIGQSYLFYGPEGIGKKLFAVKLAKSLLCENDIFWGCNNCSPCRKVERGTHSDLNIYEPENTLISIEQIRLIIDKLKYKPIESNYSIHIIDAVETMRIEAANAFLKIIEEPPEYALLILITTVLDVLPATIRSRTQIIKFNKLSEREIRDFLISQNFNHDEAELLSLWSNGSLSKALKIDFDTYLAIRNSAFEIFKYMIDKNKDITFPECIPVGFKRGKEKSNIIKDNFQILLYLLADVILESVHIKTMGKSLHHPDLYKQLTKICSEIKIDDMFLWLQQLEKIKEEYKIFHKNYVSLLQKLILINA